MEGRRGERFALLGLLGIFLVTVAWWAFALWPPPGGTPEWLARARAVCFNARPNGLPDTSGWMLLIGQPIGMFALLMAIAGDSVRAGLASLRRSTGGIVALVGGAVVLALGLVGSGVRVAGAVGSTDMWTVLDEAPPATYPRIDRPLPDFSLVDQYGKAVSRTGMLGRPVLMTFAFGHCRTLCPLVVHQASRAHRQLAAEGLAEGSPMLLVVTLDPWRDTPARLPHLARQWELPTDAYAVSGSVDDVNALLDRMEVPRERDLDTGDIVHPGVVYLIDSEGTIAFASTGGTGQLVALAGRL